MQEDSDFWLLLCILGFDDFVGVLRQFAQQGVRSGTGIDADPVLGRFVIGLADTVIARLEFVYPLRLAFERHNAVMVYVQKREHVSADIEHQQIKMERKRFIIFLYIFNVLNVLVS